MRVIKKSTLLETVADRYRAAHQRRGEWMAAPDGSDPAAVYAKLQQLPPNADEAAVTAIIGDNRYTANICDECHNDVPVTVLLAEEIHHPTDSVTLCTICLAAALELAGG